MSQQSKVPNWAVSAMAAIIAGLAMWLGAQVFYLANEFRGHQVRLEKLEERVDRHHPGGK